MTEQMYATALSCDCYPGCWGVHSTDWPYMELDDEDCAREAYRLVFQENELGVVREVAPARGTFVLVGNRLRFLDSGMLNEHVNRLQSLGKWHLVSYVHPETAEAVPAAAGSVLASLRARFQPATGPVHVEERGGAVWAMWSPESSGTRYDVVLIRAPRHAFGQSGKVVTVIAGTPGIQRVAFLNPTAGVLAASYVEGHLNERGEPFSQTDIYRLTEMVATLLGREPRLPDPRFRLASGNTPFRKL